MNLTSPTRDLILRAIGNGENTAPAIAAATGMKPNTVAVTLYGMADRGMVRRAGSLIKGHGRPPIKWNLVEPMEASQ